MDTTIDEVSIEIDANAQSASNGLDLLAKSIEKLQTRLNIGLKGIGKFNSAIINLKKISSSTNIDNKSFQNLQNNLDGIKGLTNTNNLKSTLEQIKEIPNITKSLDEKTVSDFTSRIKELTSALSPLATEMVKVSTAFSALPSNITKINTSLSKAKKIVKDSTNKGNFIDNLFGGKYSGILKIGLLVSGIQRLGTTIGGFVNQSNAYIENMNLFSVSMGEAADKAKEFIDQYTSVLGVDPSNMMRYIGMFNSLVEGFGLSSDAAYTMSKNLTQLSYDMSSFLNISVEDAMQKLKSGISGEIEPMRAVGVALDQATLQETAYALGIDKKVSAMTRAQKTELLYYQIMTKTTKMQGDMARTLISPANSLRILQQQFTQLARAIGNIFIPILMAIVPYVQVVVKWLTTLANTIASLFGFKISDYTADFSNISSGLGNISTGLDDVGSSAGETNKELDKMLGKFDELNVIDFGDTTGSSGGSGIGDVGTGGSLGIPLPDYDALTGALTQNLDEVEKKLKNLLPYVESIGLAFLAWKISSSILKFLDKIGLISNLSSALRIAAGVSIAIGGAWLLYKGIEQALDEGLTPESILKIVSGGLMVGAGLSLAFKSIVPLKVSASILLALAAFEIAREGIAEDNIVKQLIAALSAGAVGSTILGFFNKYAGIGMKIKFGLQIAIAFMEIEMAISIVKWWNEYFDEQKQEIYGDKKELNLFETINVGFSAVGQGVANQIDKIFGEGTIDKVVQWVAEILKAKDELFEKLNLQGLIEQISNAFDTIGNVFSILFSKIKEGIDFISPYIVTGFEVAWITIQTVWGIAVSFFKIIWEGIKDVFSVVKEVIGGFFETAWETVKSVWNVAVNFFELIWSGIEAVFSVVESILSGDFSGAWESIKNVWNKVVEFFQSIWDGIKNIFGSVGEWFNNIFSTAWNNIKSWFTWEKWSGLIQDALNAIKSGFENLDIKFKLPHFSWSSTPASGWIADVLSALNLPTELPKLNVEWYAEGGFPDTGELFIARESGPELVGNIGNRAAVANNDQIVEGIAEAAYQGVSQAMRENKGNERQPVNVYIGNKKIYSGYGKYATSENNRYGTSIIKV